MARHIRHIIALGFAALLVAGTGACDRKAHGTLSVAVIGGEPGLRDPSTGALSQPDAVLAGNVAQGLVRFDAAGNIVPGLAERWNVSDDGLSYIFRVATAEWPDGSKITAHQVARILNGHLRAGSKNRLKDTLGAVEDIVARPVRGIEIRLIAPRRILLPLLAQPEFGIIRNGQGTGPFSFSPTGGAGGELRLASEVVSTNEEVTRREEVLLKGSAAREAVRGFANGTIHMVLGGTFTDLPYAQSARLRRGSLRFDPASGLFGLIPAARGGPLDERDVRRLLNRAIDREALVQAMNVPGLAGRATVLEPGLDGMTVPVQPAWFFVPMTERRPQLVSEANRLFPDGEKPAIRIAAPEGPGADRLIRRLAVDWGALGFKVERSAAARSADFRLVDLVAPSTSAAWFLREFRCGAVPVCDEEADALLAAAREALIPAQRYALLAQAAARIDDTHLFFPLAAPVRWSLVSDRVPGFAGNRYARHTLTDLEQKPSRGGS
jgi:peptide/nickel transport system substrate-binding protein